MNFLELLFGLSLDGGSGSVELTIVVAVILVAVAVTWRRSLRKNLQAFQH